MKHLLLSLPGSSESLRHFVPKPEFSTSKNCIISELVLNIMQSVFLPFILVFLLILRQEKLFHAGLLAKDFCAVFFLPKEIYTSNNIVPSVDHLKTTRPLQWRDRAGFSPDFSASACRLRMVLKKQISRSRCASAAASAPVPAVAAADAPPTGRKRSSFIIP